ncbi:hypothetical protein [Metapseudomonas furukawaii]|jgi:hypothetical protein|uniref:Uncharacterized protein n=1 Tax=Metapseudomonas furukawaii TaxID=1149133 RepID=A0AAD1C2W1_METFU|nr:hypothetical protein [Pseudomonas furukawaii]ELS29382.1 hypothetical protein ppKF707_4376 [Pseudomonas furukawaii]WAG77662.1 hypothetical protein LMK08_20185 [Pseudomonas furukawaii]BAU75767.1 hypothetical protein KF707C_40790 [Pseudomonas furukawaii]
MIRTSLLLLATLATQAALASPPVVEAFLADPVAVLDEQGKLQREVARQELPGQPLTVLQYNEDLELVQVELSGQKIWLDTVDLRLNPSKIVKLPCQKLPTSQATDQHNNSTIGFGAGCSQ